MIFGKTYSQQERDLQAEIAERAKWRTWFAWFPVELSDGRWAWWQNVEVREVYLDWCNDYRCDYRQKESDADTAVRHRS